MQTIRSFIAIELSDEAQAALAELQNRLKPKMPPHTVSWTAPQKIHLTLHFLGDVAVDKIEATSQALAESVTGLSPFSLQLIDLGCFPNPQRPRIIWVGIGGDIEALVTLQRRLGVMLNELTGFTPESRPYAPHLTIGRVKKGIPSRRLSQLSQSLSQEQTKIGYLAPLPVTEVGLIKSELSPTGAVYTRLAHHVLEGNP